MARKYKTTKPGGVAEDPMPQEITSVTPTVEAATTAEPGGEHLNRALPARDLMETSGIEHAGRPMAEPTGDPPESVKPADGPVYAADPRPVMTVNLGGYSGGPMLTF